MWDMELPSEHLPTLARVVRGEVDLRNVTGDLAPLLANLSCSVRLYNMELDAKATRGLRRSFPSVVHSTGTSSSC